MSIRMEISIFQKASGKTVKSLSDTLSTLAKDAPMEDIEDAGSSLVSAASNVRAVCIIKTHLHVQL